LVGKAPLKPIDLTVKGALKKVELYVTYTSGSMEAIYKDEFKESFLELFKTTLPSIELNFIDDSNPISTPKSSKSEVLALTALLKYEHPTCLQANILIERGQ
jgi:hypothetical protein